MSANVAMESLEVCEKSIRICNAIGVLTSEEVSSVTIYNDRADFEGQNSRIDVSREFGDFNQTYFGDSLLEALEVAVEEMRASKSQ